jgi:hypothetical protein
MIRVSEEDDCPTKDFTPGTPQGSCWSDNHYKCGECVFFRADFKSDSTLREKLLDGQGGMILTIMK